MSVHMRPRGLVCARVTLCVRVTVRARAFFRLVLNTKTRNSERISKK